MKNNILYIISIFLLLITSCKKVELPEPSEGDPVFSIQGNLDGEKLEIEAGRKDFYMFSSFRKNVNASFYSFMGEFAKTVDCTDQCKESLLIGFRDIRLSQQDFEFSSDFQLVPFTFTGSNQDGIPDTTYIVTFENRSVGNDGTELTPLLFFGDGDSSFLFNPLSHEYNQLPIPDVKLTSTLMTDQGVYSNSITHEIDPYNNSNCFVSIDVEHDSTGFVTLTAEPEGINPANFNWTTQGIDTFTQIQWMEQNQVEHCVTITNQEEDSCSSCVNIIWNENQEIAPLFVSANFEYQVETDIEIVNNFLDLASMFVEYTDPSGVVYSSTNNIQPESSFIEGIKVEDYDENEKGELTKKIEVFFQCTLYSDNDESIVLENASAVIAIAYPNE